MRKILGHGVILYLKIYKHISQKHLNDCQKLFYFGKSIDNLRDNYRGTKLLIMRNSIYVKI